MVARGREFLERKGRTEPRLEAELLVAHALGRTRMELFLSLDAPVQEDEIARARELLVRRSKGEPCAYLTGAREFYGRDFRVGPGVLVPRPETELLVDVARERLAARALESPRILELGTGSGCIAVTLALEVPGARVLASDVSERALAAARGNAERLGAEVAFVHGDGTGPLLAAVEADGPADLCVSNPPYVDPDVPNGLDPDVARHEPREALFAPPGDPDHWVRRLVEERELLVGAAGTLLVELGFDQAERVRRLLSERGLEGRFHADLQGHERVLEL